jgi:DNA-binding GntR family transcriptional regulator
MSTPHPDRSTAVWSYSPPARLNPKVLPVNSDGVSRIAKAPGNTGTRTTDLVAKIVEEIRRAIFDARIIPGERIRQDVLAGELGVSKVPVREALKTLTAQGLVTYTMNAGFSVARLNQDTLRETYRMRALLEDDLLDPLPQISDDTLKDLNSLNLGMQEASEREDISSIVAMNHDFHFAIFSLTGQELTIAMLERLWDLSASYHSTYLLDADSRRRVIDQHSEIIAALKNADGEAYTAHMREHRDLSERKLRAVLKDHNPFEKISRE